MKKAVAIAMAFFLEDVNLGILSPCRRGDYPMRVGKLLCGKINGELRVRKSRNCPKNTRKRLYK